MTGSSYDPSCEGNYCPPDCENVFDMVHVSYLIRGGTRVMWELLPTFTDPQPWSFQLQVGETGVEAADDWEDVGGFEFCEMRRQHGSDYKRLVDFFPFFYS